jgi:hypothetical protein
VQVSCLRSVSLSATLQLLENRWCASAPLLIAVPFPSPPPPTVQLVDIVVVVVVIVVVADVAPMEFMVAVVVFVVVVFAVDTLLADVTSVFVSTITCVPSPMTPLWLFATTNAEFSSLVMLM